MLLRPDLKYGAMQEHSNLKAACTCCDLVAHDLVVSYGIEGSSILYNTSYATYDCAIL